MHDEILRLSLQYPIAHLFIIWFYDFKVIVEKAERSDIPNIDKKK